MLIKFFRPSYLKQNKSYLIAFFTKLSSIFFVAGLYFSYKAPLDYQHGALIKMMFIHVPFSWLAILIYISLVVILILLFIQKIAILDYIALQSAKNGAIFCALSLITGSIWGKQAWGVFWIWDARLTAMLCLFLTFCMYIVIYNLQFYNPAKHRILMIFVLIGAINIPIIKFSVEYWHTLHQPSSIIRKGGVAIDFVFLQPLILFFISFCFLHLLILLFDVIIKIHKK